MTDPLELGRLYGRRKGPKLRDRPARLIAELLPQVAVPETGALSRERLFPAGGIDALWLEVGFGKGEHLMSLAKSHPRIGFIGCEPFVNGMAACLGKLEDEGLGNVRLHMGDALDVITRLPDASVERLFVLHPDPWPKARHAKRRFINPGPLAQIARVLVPGGELRVGTDHPIYLTWTLQQLTRHPDFIWQVESAADWAQRPADWPETCYEAWSLAEGRPVWYLRYQRRAAAPVVGD